MGATVYKVFSTNALVRRGWTRQLVNQLLGKPDATEPNPRFPGQGEMRLYDRARVEIGEQSEEFIALQRRNGRWPTAQNPDVTQ
jgi:hypothetical protein